MSKRYTQEFKKWFLIGGVDGLQDRARQRVFACCGLPHNILNTKLDQASHIGFVEIQDRHACQMLSISYAKTPLSWDESKGKVH